MNNKINSLPESIGELRNLRKLMLENNRIGVLPEGIGNLKNLTDLDLRSNHLTALPEEIGSLHALRFLDLRNNQLTSLPSCLQHLPQLEKLDALTATTVPRSGFIVSPTSSKASRMMVCFGDSPSSIFPVGAGQCPGKRGAQSARRTEEFFDLV